MESKRNNFKPIISKIIWIAAIIGVFVSLYFFFVYKHPLYVYDTDDWFYISRIRTGVPIISAWNPNRVLPEVLMPLAAELGIDFIMPLTGDYLGSIAISCAIILCLFITIYSVLFVRFIKHESKIDNKLCIILLPVIVMLHFLPFFTEFFNYSHMFYADDVTCVFYYVISSLVNSSLVLYLWTKKEINWKDKNRIVYSGLLILWIYVSVYSNVFQSIILVAFCGVLVVENLIDNIAGKKKSAKFSFWKFVKSNIDRLIIIIVWLVSLYFESNGGRSDSLQNEMLFSDSVNNFFLVFRHLNVYFIVFVCGIIILSLIVFLISRFSKKTKNDTEIIAIGNRFLRNIIKAFACFVITSIFLILLCSKVNVGYLYRPSVMFGAIFYLLVMAIISLGYVLERIPYFALIIPVAIFILISEVVVTRHNYNDIYDPEKSKIVGESIVNQVLEAEESGSTYVEVYVPNDGGMYWPFNIYNGGEKIANTLYNNGITRTKMTIVLIQEQ